MFTPRASGVLLHPTSVPSPYGIGDLGDATYRFIDWLASSGQSWWQILPLTPTWEDGSPYKSPSAFAGNPLLISPDRLLRDGILVEEEVASLRDATGPRHGRVEFATAMRTKKKLFEQAYERFHSGADGSGLADAFAQFRQKQGYWLEPFTLYLALRDSNEGKTWTDWTEFVDPETRRPSAGVSDSLKKKADVFAFEQFLFESQWQELRAYARDKGIRIIGDIPIYVSDDSSDVWDNRELFELDPDGKAKEMAGVPPDYFSATGQLWKNPIYNWPVLESQNYEWWVQRLKRTLEQVDVVRIDHFRGFEAYWSVPRGEETAVKGEWKPGPGEKLFHALAAGLGQPEALPLIAEDLGVITPPVTALRKQFGLPGMKVYQFELLDSDESCWKPETYEPDTVAYTGTHDNDTTVGWFRKEILPESYRLDRVRSLMHAEIETIAWDMVEKTWGAGSLLAVAPLQDLMGLDTECRMNLPGTEWPNEPNWRWRYEEERLTPELASRLLDLTVHCGRKL